MRHFEVGVACLDARTLVSEGKPKAELLLLEAETEETKDGEDEKSIPGRNVLSFVILIIIVVVLFFLWNNYVLQLSSSRLFYYGWINHLI